MTITLSRYTDDVTPVLEDIVFSGSLDTSTDGQAITRYIITSSTAIGNFQVAEQDIGEHQDLGPFELLYRLEGYVSRRQGATPGTVDNPTVETLKQWDEEPKTTDDFKAGRFQIKIDDFEPYSLTAVGTGSNQIGLFWKGITWTNDYVKNQLVSNFVIDLIVNRGDDQ